MSPHVVFQDSTKPIQEGDIVCLLPGSSKPTIIRLHNGSSSIIMIAVPLLDNLQKRLASITIFLNDLLLVWDWDESQGSCKAEKTINTF
jgi:hypothetical protein